MASVNVQSRFDVEPGHRIKSIPGVEFDQYEQPALYPSLLPRHANWYGRWGKRSADVALAVTALVILAPVFVLVAVLVRWRLGSGGVIYRQTRVGRHGIGFDIYKFRSMLPDRRVEARPFVGTDRRVTHKSDNDPRHTPFGRFLRATSLDELPQLVNVVKGDMSLVGPRPELMSVADRTGLVGHPRHCERPGITGLFQVSRFRATNRISSGLHLDLAYVTDVRLSHDVLILWRTIGVVLGRRS